MYLVVVNLENSREMAVAHATANKRILIGRKPHIHDANNAETLRITWHDRYVSRNHAEAIRIADDVQLTRLPALTGGNKPNPFHTLAPPVDRQPIEEPLTLKLGEGVAIGTRGQSAIFWIESLGDLTPALNHYKEQAAASTAEQVSPTLSSKLKKHGDGSEIDEYSLRVQLKLLQRELPQKLLGGWENESDLFTRAGSFLEKALPLQRGVSVAFLAMDQTTPPIRYEILNPDPMKRADFAPNTALLERVDYADLDPDSLYLWEAKKSQSGSDRLGSFSEKVDWVAVIPVARADSKQAFYRDGEDRPVYLYIETRDSKSVAAASYIPFIRLITTLLATLLSARSEQRMQDQMAAYFSPGLRDIMKVADQSILRPAMVDCTVMFTDRRGHSRILESARNDEEILDRLDENQRIVGSITEEIFNSNGVVTDFAGDGALGLWGWPNFGGNAENHALKALEAAEAMAERFASLVEYEPQLGREMSAVRIGISTGRIAVGRTGPEQQWHISVFGSVANLGARLERIAKEFKVPVLLSDETYCRIEGLTERRFRRLCHIRPAGFDQSYPIYELVLPIEWGGSGVDDETIRQYETALERFNAEKWDESIDILSSLPEEDPATQYLLSKAHAFRDDPPPAGWAGEIQSLSK